MRVEATFSTSAYRISLLPMRVIVVYSSSAAILLVCNSVSSELKAPRIMHTGTVKLLDAALSTEDLWADYI